MPNTTRRSALCVAGDCRKRADPRIETVPLCTKHAADVAKSVYRIMPTATLPPEVLEQRLADRETFQARKDAQKAAQEEQSVVYYIRMKNDLIKIGYTTNLVARLVSLRVSKDDVLVTEPGGPAKERERHEQFAHLRHGRWEEFDPADELLGHMARLHRQYGDPVITGYVKTPA